MCPSDAIWCQRSGSTLAQVMACSLTAPSYYLNQCWLIISKVHWHLSEGNFTIDPSAMNHLNQGWGQVKYLYLVLGTWCELSSTWYLLVLDLLKFKSTWYLLVLDGQSTWYLSKYFCQINKYSVLNPWFTVPELRPDDPIYWQNSGEHWFRLRLVSSLVQATTTKL